jgi:hypothetical protein
MNVQEPSVRTGACVLTEPSLLFNICVRKFSAISRLQELQETHIKKLIVCHVVILLPGGDVGICTGRLMLQTHRPMLARP